MLQSMIFYPDLPMTHEQGMQYLKEALISMIVDVEKIKGDIKSMKEKQPEVSEEFKKELIAIKGIGEKTAEDILTVYPTRDFLILDLAAGKKLPFRDDIQRLLEANYLR